MASSKISNIMHISAYTGDNNGEVLVFLVFLESKHFFYRISN